MTQEEQIKQVAEYMGMEILEPTEAGYHVKHHKNDKLYHGPSSLKYHTSLDWLNPVWVKVYAESVIVRGELKSKDRLTSRIHSKWYNLYKNYHEAINTGNISAALTAVSDAITWLKEQKK